MASTVVPQTDARIEQSQAGPIITRETMYCCGRGPQDALIKVNSAIDYMLYMQMQVNLKQGHGDINAT